MNIEFKEVGIMNPNLVRESAKTVKSKYSRLHKTHDHDTNECICIKDINQELIKRDGPLGTPEAEV